MKVSFIILSAAVLYFHVARGLPADNNKRQTDAQTPAPAASAAPAAPEKPETCKATIEGHEQTLNTGDRYCLDDHTHRVCNYGDWIDNPCPETSKCLKHKTEWKVLCRIVNRNPPQPPHPQDSDMPPSAQSPDASKPVPAPKVDSPPPPPPKVDSPPPPPPKVDSPPPPPPKVDSPPPPPPKEEKPEPEPPKKPEQPKPTPEVEQPHPTPAVDQPKTEPPTATTPPKPETCKATIDGKEETLQPGDRYCLNDNTNRVCNWGEFVDYTCPSDSKCLKSPEKWQVLCRVINKNAAQKGADGH
jgi:hypothetical protein